MSRYTSMNSQDMDSSQDITRAISIDGDIPSRSYYASHIHVDSATNARYSESADSIRAYTLELGDQYINDITSSNDITRPMSNHTEDSIPRPIVPSPAYNKQSALSRLLKRNPGSHEDQPLIKRHLSSTDYLSTVSTNTTSPSIDIDSEEWSESINNLLYSNRRTDKHRPPSNILHKMRSPSAWIHCFTQPIHYIPAVILGLLLNLLDAISYGMITFPLNNPIFAAFGPEGISMFFVSCIISQIVYSAGGSVFDGGNGSMMIEVVPFLHIMTEKIVSVVGEDNPEVAISSTMVAFALSSIMTGLAFFLLGALKLGSLIGFFPRHILVGTIGGVGWFLVATGIEVSGRLDESLSYTLPMFKKIFLDGHIFSLWSSSLGVALLLRFIQHRLSSPMVVPIFFMVLPFVFYAIVFICRLDVHAVRDAGWIFPLVESNIPFWHFYTYYNFTKVNWSAVAETIPAMLALTFFGVLHVPINVPALGVSTNQDNVNVNRELVGHGISNVVSGLFGSVQNYLVYTNSLLFIRSGGDSRVAGFMLAGATAILWMVGPWIVGYIPVMVVGSLIFHLGLDLLKEALIDTYKAVHYLEYITICVIIACMATIGFVEGIFVGIIMACIFFVVQNARNSEAIRTTYTGQYMRSTIRRLYRQERFLREVGGQIQVVKLQGYLFFGTIVQVERAIRNMLDDNVWEKHPIRFLILDFQLVQGVDFSAAEAFVRIRRLLKVKQVYMILCNFTKGSDAEKSLVNAGVWVDNYAHEEGDIKCFERLNDALEWCENKLLTSCFQKRSRSLYVMPDAQPRKSISETSRLLEVGSPRREMVTNALHHLINDTRAPAVHSNATQPTLILTQVFGEISQENIPVEFFHRLSRYFERRTTKAGHTVYREGDPCSFLLILEQGLLKGMMTLNKEEVTIETILPGTVVGELGIFTTSQVRTRSLVAEQDSVYWALTKTSFEKMCKDDPAMANKFILLSLYFSNERLDTMTRYAFHLH
ncbi:sulfate transporter family-domain-containing protein [Pilobolus umbonatus]|nr:sulfate transporter family-domain-containing protein [Pilobolus umbonatus]